MNFAFVIFFLILSNVEVNCNEQELKWSLYTIAKVFLTTRQVELVRDKEFVITVLDSKNETFVVNIASPSISDMNQVYSFQKTQIASFKLNKIPTTIFIENSDFVDIFLPKLATELSKHTEIKNYAINFVDSKEPLYKPIYSLKPEELTNLNTYIEINLVHSFTRPLKLSVDNPIFFV